MLLFLLEEHDMVKKYSGVYRDKNNKIYYKIRLGKDPITLKFDQKKSYKDENGRLFETEEEAYFAAQTALLTNRKFQRSSKDRNMTFHVYLWEVFNKQYELEVQSSTFRRSQSQLKLFDTRFGKKKLRDISALDCDLFKQWLVKTSSPGYAVTMWGRFKAVLGYAERVKLIDEFPAANLHGPRRPRTVTPYWTFDDFVSVMKSYNLENYDEQWYASSIWLYYMSGVRVSEGRALQWSDVLFEKKLLRVRATLEWVPETRTWWKKPHTKTESGMRDIPIDDETLEVLRRWKKRQGGKKDTYVLANKDSGVPLSKSALTSETKRRADLVDVPEITGKGLRHSHASYLINVLKETNHKVIQQRMGHKSIKTTLDVYAHLYLAPDGFEKSAEITKQLQNAGVSLFHDDKKCGTKNGTKIRILSKEPHNREVG